METKHLDESTFEVSIPALSIIAALIMIFLMFPCLCCEFEGRENLLGVLFKLGLVSHPLHLLCPKDALSVWDLCFIKVFLLPRYSTKISQIHSCLAYGGHYSFQSHGGRLCFKSVSEWWSWWRRSSPTGRLSFTAHLPFTSEGGPASVSLQGLLGAPGSQVAHQHW